MGKKKKKKRLTQMFKTPDRWLPTNNTRPQIFKDKTKTSDKNAARGRTYRDADGSD